MASTTINIVKVILDVLGSISKPITADEISFRARAPRSSINEPLHKLKEANIVIERNHAFLLNPKKQDYRLESLLS
jgi:DNA-binding transcriptional regulator GbsR (MarR family)